MCERGKSDRARTFLGGMIAFNKRNSTMDCRVRDFSATGARVHLPIPQLSRISSI